MTDKNVIILVGAETLRGLRVGMGMAVTTLNLMAGKVAEQIKNGEDVKANEEKLLRIVVSLVDVEDAFAIIKGVEQNLQNETLN